MHGCSRLAGERGGQWNICIDRKKAVYQEMTAHIQRKLAQKDKTQSSMICTSPRPTENPHRPNLPVQDIVDKRCVRRFWMVPGRQYRHVVCRGEIFHIRYLLSSRGRLFVLYVRRRAIDFTGYLVPGTHYVIITTNCHRRKAREQ